MTSMRRPRAGADIPISINHRRFGGGGSSVDLGVQEAGYAGPPQPPWNNTQAASGGHGGYQPPGQPPAPPPPYSRDGGEFTPEVREFAPVSFAIIRDRSHSLIFESHTICYNEAPRTSASCSYEILSADKRNIMGFSVNDSRGTGVCWILRHDISFIYWAVVPSRILEIIERGKCVHQGT
ncbi:hypothetical protein BKA93DRAFT_353690 [Sparassis latifolia]